MSAPDITQTTHTMKLFILAVCMAFTAQVARSQSDVERQLILEARSRSNDGLKNLDVNAVMAEIDSLYRGTGGDGGFAENYPQMVEIYEADFGASSPVTYHRTAESVEVSESLSRAFELGTWTGGTDGAPESMGGRYSAHWVNTESGWKIRSELFVTLYSN